MEEKTIIMETETEIIKNLQEKTVFSPLQIKRFVLGRALGDSIYKITFYEDVYKRKKNGDNKNEKVVLTDIEKRIEFKKLFNDEGFRDLVAVKKNELGIFDINIEESRLIEKLISIMEGKAQGKKLVKVSKREFTNGKMASIEEEYVEVDNFPSVAEQSKAVERLHKLGYLEKKDKVKIELENEKLNNEANNLVEDFANITKNADIEQRRKENEERIKEARKLNSEKTFNEEDITIEEINEVLDV